MNQKVFLISILAAPEAATKAFTRHAVIYAWEAMILRECLTDAFRR